MQDLAIIGAGVAGLSATRAAREAGATPTVLEAAHSPGGRCATGHTTLDGATHWFDYGAQYFTADDAAFRHHVTSECVAGRLRRWQPVPCLAQRRQGAWHCDASPDARERLIAPNGMHAWVCAGFEAADIDLRCGARVTRVERDADGWTLRMAHDAAPVRARRVLLTLPAPDAAALLDGGERTALEALCTPAAALSVCHAVVVAAPRLAACQAVFVRDGALSWIADNSHKAGEQDRPRHLWTLHASPAFSDARRDVAGADAAAPLVAEFRAITGLSGAAIDVVHTQRWRQARPGPGAPDPIPGYHVDASGTLALAGDWLAGGRVEGAWRSGRAAARALMAD